jgi:DNA-binding IclR family transcriptional regulator
MSQRSVLKTLDRGLQAVDIVAASPSGLSVAVLAERLGIDRAIAYRLTATLEGRGFLRRDQRGLVYLGPHILLLAEALRPQLRAVAQPLLERLAEATNATAFLSVADREECVAVLVAEPSGGLLRVGYRVGSRHPLTRGAAGLAILAGRPEAPDDPPEVREARALGYSLTAGQLQRGAVGVASPVKHSGDSARDLDASVGVVALEDLDRDRAVEEVPSAAARLRSVLL